MTGERSHMHYTTSEAPHIIKVLKSNAEFLRLAWLAEGDQVVQQASRRHALLKFNSS